MQLITATDLPVIEALLNEVEEVYRVDPVGNY
jgi:hypothetical protein